MNLSPVECCNSALALSALHCQAESSVWVGRAKRNRLEEFGLSRQDLGRPIC